MMQTKLSRISAQIPDRTKIDSGQYVTASSSVVFQTMDNDDTNTLVATWDLLGFHGEGEFFNPNIADADFNFDYDSDFERLVEDMDAYAAKLAKQSGLVTSRQDPIDNQYFWTVAEPTPIQQLKITHDTRADIDDAESAVVAASREGGSTWQEIGNALGISRQ
ncbi:hypothetical protein [Cryobacterium aureum]|uniref:hypothetical protein n=1 Tax=Cryobacterium aureum TaxID=995037 RepID=UPI000CF3CD13|nr:hypothetical protein [Cryobacterium aureum]